MVMLDLGAPAYKMGQVDRESMAKSLESADKVSVAISCNLIRAVIQAKFPQGMDGKDGRRWARISDLILDNERNIELGRDDFDWLYKIYTDDNLKLLPALQGWRVALEEYLDSLKDAFRQAEKTQEVT